MIIYDAEYSWDGGWRPSRDGHVSHSATAQYTIPSSAARWEHRRTAKARVSGPTPKSGKDGADVC